MSGFLANLLGDQDEEDVVLGATGGKPKGHADAPRAAPKRAEAPPADAPPVDAPLVDPPDDAAEHE